MKCGINSHRLWCWKTEWQMSYFICTTLDHQVCDAPPFSLIDPLSLNLQGQILGHFSSLDYSEVAQFWTYNNTYIHGNRHICNNRISLLWTKEGDCITSECDLRDLKDIWIYIKALHYLVFFSTRVKIDILKHWSRQKLYFSQKLKFRLRVIHDDRATTN